MQRRGDEGAAAVEFALVLPLLVLLVFGIIDFGRLYYEQITLTDAAREGVRVVALQGTLATATTTVQNAAGDTGVSVQATPTTLPCTAGQTVTVTATESFSFLTPLPDLAGFTGVSSVTGKAAMRCGG